jgi:Yip1 domain
MFAQNQAVITKPISFWTYLGLILTAPVKGFTRLMQDSRRLRSGLEAVLFVAIGYTVALILIASSPGRISKIVAWVAIPLERYFFWEVFFIGAVTFGCWLLASGVVYLLSRIVGGKGTFDDTLAALGFAVAIPTTFAFLHDCITGFMTATGIMSAEAWERSISTPSVGLVLFWAYMLIYLLGLLVFFPVATTVAQRLPKGHGLWIGLLGVVVYQGVYFIFIR